MNPVHTVRLKDRFIATLADVLMDTCGSSIHRAAVVFEGKRPALFLKKELAQRKKEAFIPPVMFSIDEFMGYAAGGGNTVRFIPELDAVYYLYTIIRSKDIKILPGISSFSAFGPWGEEIAAIIEQLDVENIQNSSLEAVHRSAAIGYDVPESINTLLVFLSEIRQSFHKLLKEKRLFTRGFAYQEAFRRAEELAFDRFDTVIFADFFKPHRTEEGLMDILCRRGKGIRIQQESDERLSDIPVSLYQGFDTHSQACIGREIVKTITDPDDTVIVLPRSETVEPLLAEIAGYVPDYNVSMGYPLKQNTLYSLCMLIMAAQETRNDGRYYAGEYLPVLMHPLVKNISFGKEPAVTRIIIHTIEEYLKGKRTSPISGSISFPLDDVIREDGIIDDALRLIREAGIDTDKQECMRILAEIHRLFFVQWEEVRTCAQYATCGRNCIRAIFSHDTAGSSPILVKAGIRILEIFDELENAVCAGIAFSAQEIRDIVERKLDAARISFSGAPLKGMQILGLFETRSLSFKHVIILDANESVIPSLRVYEPLIPREVMAALGLNRLKQEEEIQRHHVMRLMSAAQQVHIIYEERGKKERSRFVEELIWEKEKKAGGLIPRMIRKASFAMTLPGKSVPVPKTNAVARFVASQPFSPSRLNTYLSCPLRFYYAYVLGLEEEDNLLEAPESRHIGTFVHELLEKAFLPFAGKKPVIDEHFKACFLHLFEDKFDREMRPRMKSDSFLLYGVLKKRLAAFLDKEARRPVQRLIGLEQEYRQPYTIHNMNISFSCRVDRIDELADGSVRIVDYKTGSVSGIPKRLKTLTSMNVDRESIRRTVVSFQLPLYYYVIKQQYPGKCLNAELYSIRTGEEALFIADKEREHCDDIEKSCMSAADFIISEILDTDIPFAACADEHTCGYCPFSFFCFS